MTEPATSASPATPPNPSEIIEVVEAPGDDLIRRLTLPRAGRPREAALHGADHRAREAAIATLEAAFPSLPIRRSTQATDATTLVVGRADPALVDALDARQLIERTLGRLTFQPSTQIRLVRDQVTRTLDDIIQVRPTSYPGGHPRVKTAALAGALDDGYSVVLDGIDLRDPVSAMLAGLFERSFGCPVNINAYLSARANTSFGAHWDDQEVVILQLIGRKDWTIEEPVDLSMDKTVHGEVVSGRPVWRGRTEPATAIYVPRGWGHTVNGIDELSYHYTITIPRVNGLQILDGVLDQVAADHRDSGRSLTLPTIGGTGPSPEDEAGLEAPAPQDPSRTPPTSGRSGDGSHGDSAGPSPELWESLAAEIAIPVDARSLDPVSLDDLVRRALARARFRTPRRSTASLRANAQALLSDDGAEVLVRCPCPGGWVTDGEPVEETDDEVVEVGDEERSRPDATGGTMDRGHKSARTGRADDHIVAGMAGQLVSIPAAHLDEVAALTDGRVHATDAGPGTVARELIRLGLLEVVTDPSVWGLTSA